MNGQTLDTARVPLPGGAIADYHASGFNAYGHADWLGTTRFGSTATRTKDGDWAFAPFAEVYAGSSTSYSAFTGQTSDMGSNLWDFSFREYHSSQGRWISPDPAGLAAVNPVNPQTWNRYAYVEGNPLSNVDPLGLCDDKPCQPPGHFSDAVSPSDGGCSINGLSVDCRAVMAFAGAGGGGEFGVLCSTCSSFGYGTQWNVVGGDLMQNVPTAPSYNPDDGGTYGAIVKDAEWMDLGPVSLTIAANNSSWGWNFTKAFFGGLVSSAGWKAVYHSFGEAGCDRLMAETFAEGFNPLPGGDPDAGTALEVGSKAVAQVGRSAATAYSISKGLSVPLRSSIYRGLQSSTYGYAAAFEEAAPYLQVGTRVGALSTPPARQHTTENVIERIDAWKGRSEIVSVRRDSPVRLSGFRGSHRSQQGCEDFRRLDRAGGVHRRPFLGHHKAIKAILAAFKLLVGDYGSANCSLIGIHRYSEALPPMARGLVLANYDS